jgi:hypothetical protein
VDCRVPPVGEVAALAGFQQPAQLVVGQQRRRLVRDLRRVHAGHRAGVQLALGHRPLEERLEAPVAVQGCERLPALQLVSNEGPYVVSGDRVDGHGMAARGQEVGEQPHGLGVALDRALALVLRAKGSAEAAVQRREVPSARCLGHNGKSSADRALCKASRTARPIGQWPIYRGLSCGDGIRSALAGLEPATCCSGDNCQSSVLYGPVGSSQVRLGGVFLVGAVWFSCGLWNDRENDQLSKRGRRGRAQGVCPSGAAARGLPGVNV